MNTLAFMSNLGTLEWIIFGGFFLGGPLLVVLALVMVYRAGKNAGRIQEMERRERQRQD